MSDLKVDNNGHLVIEDGDLQGVTGADALAQHLQARLSTFQGEWFLDERIGMPYFQQILGKGSSQQAIRAIFRQAILETDGVSSVSDLRLQFNGSARSLSVRFIANPGAENEVVFNRELIIDV